MREPDSGSESRACLIAARQAAKLSCQSTAFTAAPRQPICYSRPARLIFSDRCGAPNAEGGAAPPEDRGGLERGLGLKEAVALNMIEMVGIGPFVVIPLVIKAMGGPQCLLAWAAGALLALLDGFVWSELGAAMPLAGGSYVFLREAYGPGKMGRMMSFLFVWQTVIQAPLSLASGAIGFSQYASYLYPLGKYGEKAVSGVLVIRAGDAAVPPHQLDRQNLAVFVGRSGRARFCG